MLALLSLSSSSSYRRKKQALEKLISPGFVSLAGRASDSLADPRTHAVPCVLSLSRLLQSQAAAQAAGGKMRAWEVEADSELAFAHSGFCQVTG